MDTHRPVLRAGLTGGIASGKTTVAGFLYEMGAHLIDADRIAHETMEPDGAAFQDVVARFGTGILDRQGRVSRADLARIIFHDGVAREALNGIVHPRVTEEIDRRVRGHAAEGRSPIVVIDAALLVESGVYRTLHRLIVVRCGRDEQIRRLLARGELAMDEALARVEAQAPLEEKLAVAHYVIDTESTLRETRRQSEMVYAALLADFEKEFGEPGVRGDG